MLLRHDKWDGFVHRRRSLLGSGWLQGRGRRKRGQEIGQIPVQQEAEYGVVRVLFASSVLNLCELVALRPDLAPLKKVLYFHENQLVYPVRKDQERDFQYG
ncbi:hypothetical protein CRUP_008695 [Coryphaenoides rupestris]|nr:hypothetical protein CRUP_008695 [Coryphaenoides rupestris]